MPLPSRRPSRPTPSWKRAAPWSAVALGVWLASCSGDSFESVPVSAGGQGADAGQSGASQGGGSAGKTTAGTAGAPGAGSGGVSSAGAGGSGTAGQGGANPAGGKAGAAGQGGAGTSGAGTSGAGTSGTGGAVSGSSGQGGAPAGGQAGEAGAGQGGGGAPCGDPPTYYQDSDGDGFGNAAVSVVACAKPTQGSWTLNDKDCDDTNEKVNPGQTAYFSDGYPKAGSPKGISFDYNCDGKEQHKAGFAVRNKCDAALKANCGEASGYDTTGREGEGIDVLCGSSKFVKCVSNNFLGCKTDEELKDSVPCH